MSYIQPLCGCGLRPVLPLRPHHPRAEEEEVQGYGQDGQVRSRIWDYLIIRLLFQIPCGYRQDLEREERDEEEARRIDDNFILGKKAESEESKDRGVGKSAEFNGVNSFVGNGQVCSS